MRIVKKFFSALSFWYSVNKTYPVKAPGNLGAVIHISLS
jgi:hypothetical protein